MKRYALELGGLVLATCVAFDAGAAAQSCKNHYILTIPDPCLSAPGTLDKDFGTDGAALFESGFGTAGIAIQSDGKIVLAGSNRAATRDAQRVTLLRLTSTGTLDTTFGDAGRVSIETGIGGGVAASVVVRTDGRIVVGGAAWLNATDNYSDQRSAFVVAQFLPDGRLDASFGHDGTTLTSIGWSSGIARLLLQPDGKILANGSSCGERHLGCELVLARYNANGILDDEFAPPGAARVAGWGGPFTLQSDGRIVVLSRGTYSIRYPNDYRVHSPSKLLRFLHDGTLDASFGAGGVVVLPFDTQTLLAVGTKVVVAGTSQLGNVRPRLTLARLTESGELDPAFGRDGIAAEAFTQAMPIHDGLELDSAAQIRAQPDGKLVVLVNQGDAMDWAAVRVVRYTRDGTLDRRFNKRGYADFVATYLDIAGEIALQPDGKMVVATQVFERGNGVIRFRGDEVIEFVNPANGRYFVTVDPDEQESIASGAAGPGWELTGKSFNSNASIAACRFSGVPGIGPNSHFYTIDPAECEHVKQDPGWRFEGYDFAAMPADASGCSAGWVPVYRVYNNGFASGSSNHRYVTDGPTFLDMVLEGWTNEGVVFCVPE